MPTSSVPPDFRLIFESLPGLYLILDTAFGIVAASDPYLLATNTGRDQIVGRGIFDVFPDNPDDPHASGVRNLTASLNRVLAERAAHAMPVQKYDIRRPESEGGGFEERFWSPVNSPVLGPDGSVRYIVHRVEDVSEAVRFRQQGAEHERIAAELRSESADMKREVARWQQEVIERRQMEIELRESQRLVLASEARLQLMIEGVQDHAIFTLDNEGHVTSWNRGAELIYGWGSDEIIGRHRNRFFPPEDVAAGLPAWELSQAVEAGSFSEEAWRVRKDGSRFWAHGTITPLRDAAGARRGFVKVVRDLTERKQGEMDLQEVENQLRQSQKLESIGQLASGVAHDFNNLLTVISGHSEYVLMSLAPDDPMAESIQEIIKAGQRAAGLTRQLLLFGRRAVADLRVLDLNLVVADSLKLLRRMIGEDIELAAVLDPRLSRVRVDPGHIGQVLMNLCVNARDAMPEGGKLTIQTQNVELDEPYSNTHVEVQVGRYVLLTVSDTGAGMTPEVNLRIFEPFFTTKEVGQGSGLGLSVVHGIVKQSGGHIGVYSEPGIGTTFKVYLPIVEDAIEVPVADADPLRFGRGSETVLLVEDEESVRELALLALRGRGYSVISASNGKEALRLLDEQDRSIDLLVTDVVMPEMNGRQLAEVLRPRLPGMRVLFVSGYTDDAVVRHGILHAEVAFLQKPYTPMILLRKVRQVLDQDT